MKIKLMKTNCFCKGIIKRYNYEIFTHKAVFLKIFLVIVLLR